MTDTDAAEIAVTYHVLGILQQDYRTWTRLIRDHIREGFSVPRSKAAHMHPSNPHVPCLFCAANCGELSAVSSAVFSTVAERKLRDDEWNANPVREPKQVLSASKSSRPDETNLAGIFGPKWMAVLALAYRVEFSDGRGLAELLTDALRDRGIATVNAIGDRGQDWGIPARWLIARAMAGKNAPDSAPLAVRLRRREASGHIGSLANRFAASGLPTGSPDAWLAVPNTVAPVLRSAR
jgi:hypothetical protein